MNDSILPKISRQLSRLVLKRTAVLSDSLRAIRFDGEQAVLGGELSDVKAVDVLILGKEHYSEQNRTFPIQSRRELKKILSLEAANSDGIMLFVIGDYVDGQRNVVCWTVKPKALVDKQLVPQFIVPESALLLNDDNNHLYAVTRSGRTFWYVKRQQDMLCAEKKGLIANAEMFLASAGLGGDITRSELSSAQYAALMAERFLPVLLGNLSGFNSHLRKLESVDWRAHIKYSGLASIAILVGYFSLTSLYLNLRLDAAHTAQSEYSGKTRDVFDMQKQLSRIQQKDKDLSQVTNLPQAPSVIWRFIVPLMQDGVKISQINLLPTGLFIIRAEADKATDVLERIKNDPLVLEPQFRGQTSTVNDKERFEVAFKIKQGV